MNSLDARLPGLEVLISYSDLTIRRSLVRQEPHVDVVLVRGVVERGRDVHHDELAFG